jgi:hypothetical protein
LAPLETIGCGAGIPDLCRAVSDSQTGFKRKKDLQFQLANGQMITRSVGYAVPSVEAAQRS